MKKSDFLNYVSNIIDSNEVVYYDEQEQFFYFYHNHFTFQLKSNPASAFLVILEEKSFTSQQKAENETIALTSEEAIGLMEKLVPLISSNHRDYQDKKEKVGIENFNSYIALLDEFLRNYNPVQDIENHLKKGSLDDYVVYFPLDGVNHICRIGRTAKYHGKREHLLTSVVKIPFFFLESSAPKSECIPYDLIIPSWKIKEYPILENFITPKIFHEDFNQTFENMVKRFEHGKELMKEVLEFKLPSQNIKTKTPKI